MEASAGADAISDDAKAAKPGDLPSSATASYVGAPCSKADGDPSSYVSPAHKSLSSATFETPLEPVFTGFYDLPMRTSAEPAYEAFNEEGDQGVDSYRRLCMFDGFSQLPDDKSDHCEEIMNDIEGTLSKLESLKRTIGDEDEINQCSPKRTKTFDEDDDVCAESPMEAFRLLGSVRGLLNLRKARVARDALLKRNAHSRASREAELSRRISSVEKREAQLEKREGHLENREVLVWHREVLAAKKEETIDEAKADLDKKLNAYRAAVAADAAKKEETKKAEEETKKAVEEAKKAAKDLPSDETTIRQKLEKAKDFVDSSDAYTGTVEKIVDIPSRGKRLLKSYEENKEVAKKLAGYLGGVSTGALHLARIALIEALRGYVDLGIGDAGADADGGEDGSPAPAAVDASATSPEAPAPPPAPAAVDPSATSHQAPSGENPSATSPRAAAAVDPSATSPRAPAAVDPSATPPPAPAAVESSTAPPVPAAVESSATPPVPAAVESSATPSVPAAVESSATSSPTPPAGASSA